MTEKEQLDAVRPLFDQIQSLLAQGQHPDASARFKPEPELEQFLGRLTEGLTNEVD